MVSAETQSSATLFGPENALPAGEAVAVWWLCSETGLEPEESEPSAPKQLYRQCSV